MNPIINAAKMALDCFTFFLQTDSCEQPRAHLRFIVDKQNDQDDDRKPDRQIFFHSVTLRLVLDFE
jgi:hypothetical protein